MDLYNRQKKLNLNINQSVTVVGCGGIGFWVCKYLAMSGIEKIFAFDHDTIDESNLNRLDVPYKVIGMNKADLAKIIINNIRPDCTVYAMPYKFREDHKPNTDWLVDCTDDSDVQLENQRIAKSQGMKYFKAGYDGEFMGLHNVVAEWSVEEEKQTGYTFVPSWVVPASIIAAMAVAKILKYPNNEMSTSVKGLFNAQRI